MTAQAQSASGAEGGIFNSNAVAPGEIIEVPVEIRNVEDLYAIDIEIEFDPTILQVEDADPDTDGIQVAIGTFLDAGLVLYNAVDNDNGMIHFVMTQVNPSEGKTGSGVVLVIYTRGLNVGTSELAVTFLEPASRTGDAIPVEPYSASIEVMEGFVPVESTPIPVQDPAEAVMIPTLAPSPTPTITETVDAKVGLAENESTAQDPIEKSDMGSAESEAEGAPAESEFNLLNYWWAILLIVAGAVSLFFYQAKTRK